jgi:L-alanine-DL-glutamate epimerase-like enolase superfamily enzyme
VRLSQTVVCLQLREPFTSHKGRTTGVRQVVVRLHWQKWFGLGTAIPASEYGVDMNTIQSAIGTCADLLEGRSPFELEMLLDRIEAAVPDQPRALAAVDMALHDLLGQVAGLPLHRLWGLAGRPLMPTGLSLGVLPEEMLAERVRKLANWPILKLKMTPASDPRIVRRLREVYSGRLWVDGNGSWSPRQALAAADVFHDFGVELLEQPIAAGTPEQLRFVCERSPVPIVADEDCIGPRDVLRLQGCANAINIKLLKCGGLRRAFEMIRLARHAGLQVMLGCKTESALGITALAQLAGLADYLDLDGHLDLTNDPYAGIAIQFGQITLPEGAGLGITERPSTDTRRDESCLR